MTDVFVCVYERRGEEEEREGEREREREREREVEKEDRGKMKEGEGDESGRLCGAAVSCGDVTTTTYTTTAACTTQHRIRQYVKDTNALQRLVTSYTQAMLAQAVSIKQ